MTQVEDDVALALRLAAEASAVALQFFHRGIQPNTKADGTVVTEADLDVERLLIGELATLRPDDGILGEEFGQRGGSERRWIIDPIDGTASFVAGRSDWGVHIALEEDGEIVLGVVTRPVAGTRWWAQRAGGAFRSGVSSSAGQTRLRVSDQADLAGGRISSWWGRNGAPDERLRHLPGWVEPQDIDMILRVAEGNLEALVDCTPSAIWDRAPFVILVEEAGGSFHDHLGGRDLDQPGGRFTNGLVDAELAAILG
jgi:histidinol-phosphatase